MFGIGAPELIIILIIGLVLFGPGKLPEIGRALGKTIHELKKATSVNDEDVHEIHATVKSKTDNTQPTDKKTDEIK